MNYLDNLLRLYYRGINSPTLMSWGSFLLRALSLFVVLPFILTRFSVAEISLWYLFSIIIGLQSLVDLGFTPTFSRVIAYGRGGAEVQELASPRSQKSQNINWETIGKICSTMCHIYMRLALVWGVLLATAGSLVVMKPISLTEDHNAGWLAWLVIVATSVYNLRGNIYNSFLQGMEQVALLRRWEIITSVGAITSSIIALLLGAGILALIMVNQGWLIVNVFRNRWLAGKIEGGRFKNYARAEMHHDVFKAVWPSTWRSGTGIFMTYGLVQASGIFYAQVGDVNSVASYLMGLRFIQAISVFSQAPFYSKLPTLARLYSQDRKKELLAMAERGMALSYWTFAVCFIWLGAMGPGCLDYIRSNAVFPGQTLWNLLGVAYFVERYGAMHLQLYSLSNRILWHVANGVAGLIYLVTVFALFRVVGVYAFPFGILAGYLGFYSWYSARYSYREFNLYSIYFDRRTIVWPLIMIILYVTISQIIGG